MAMDESAVVRAYFMVRRRQAKRRENRDRDSVLGAGE